MKKIYLSVGSVLLLLSCATRVDYIGSTYAPSDQVDVYVARDAIKKQYEVMGKGYVRMGTAFSSFEKIQKKAVAKARQKGADAVLVEDYFVLSTDSDMATTFAKDSSRALVGMSHTQAHPSIGSGFQILFIRYRP
jgi:hypothetical protein